MRVLFASSLRGWGGGEEWFVRAPLALAERGHEVRLAARRGSLLAQRARERGLRVHEVDYGGVADPRAPLQLAAILADQHADVAVVNLEKELVALALAALGRPGVALVCRRGSDFPVRPTPLARWLYGHSVRRVLVNSPGIAETLATQGLRLPRDLLRLLPNGLDPQANDPADRAARAADWPPGPGARLISVGELSQRKDPRGVLEALARVRHPWRLLWVGEGPARREVEALIARQPWAGRVRLLGAVPQARRWTAAADALVLFSASEGQPWAVLEALVEGIPAVVTRLPGLAGLVEDGVSGFVVEAGDVEGLARTVESVLADPDAARAAGRRGADRAREQLGEGPVYDRLEHLLEGARLAARRPRRAVFLDRDGTLLPEMGALSRADAVRLLPGVAAALRRLAHAGYALVVVTNQAAIGRGLVRPADVRAVHARLRRLLRAEGVELAGIFLCPHRPEDACPCRKPEPGLLLTAARTLGLGLGESWLVGDSARDVEAAARAGVRALLVRTGWAGGEPGGPGPAVAGQRAETCDDLQAAARRIVRSGA